MPLEDSRPKGYQIELREGDKVYSTQGNAGDMSGSPAMNLEGAKRLADVENDRLPPGDNRKWVLKPLDEAQYVR